MKDELTPTTSIVQVINKIYIDEQMYKCIGRINKNNTIYPLFHELPIKLTQTEFSNLIAFRMFNF